MGVACAVVYEVATNRYRLYDASELEALQECLDRADRITTWNGWAFDLPVIYGVNRPDWDKSPYPTRPGGSKGLPLKQQLVRIERSLIEQALARTNGNVSQTARLLQLQRTTLIEKIQKYELRVG